MFESSIKEFSRKAAKAKEDYILSNLGISSNDFHLIYSTPTDWAMDKIIEFQKDHGLTQCEVMGINDLVFCFSGIQWPFLEQQDSLKYTYSIKQYWACFRKDE